MTAFGPPATPATPARPPASAEQRVALLTYVAGGLGVLSFIWGFLTWFTQGSGAHAPSAAGYSVNGAGATAVIGISLAAGLVAVARTFEKKAVSLLPVALAVAALLVVIGVVTGKSSIDDGSGNSADIGMGIGLILELITVILQTAALVLAWLMATGRMPAPRPSAPAQPQYPGYQPPQLYQPPQGYQPPQQGGYGPPAGYPQQSAPTQQQPQQQRPQQQRPQQNQPPAPQQHQPQYQPPTPPPQQQQQPQYQPQYQPPTLPQQHQPSEHPTQHFPRPDDGETPGPSQ